MINCKFCNKQCNSKRSKSAHERFCKLNPNYQENIKKHKEKVANLGVTAFILSSKERAKINPLNQIKSFNLICSKCGKLYTLNLKVKDFNKGKYPKTCSSKCAHSRVYSKEIKEKISSTRKSHQFKHKCSQCNKIFYSKNNAKTKIICNQCFFKTHRRNDLNDNSRRKNKQSGPLHKTICPNCKKEIFTKHVGNTYCHQCADKLNIFKYLLYNKNGKKLISQSTKKKLSQSTKKLMKEGKIKPWKSRKIISYAEKFFRKVLSLNNIKYQPEFPQHKYFLDFVIKTNKIIIDLQVDGKQHWLQSDRVQHDKIRDQLLTSLGYVVYRIQWNQIKSQSGKLKMKQKIKNFLNFYQSNL